ncbi:hypothetical protein [Variovorax sp. 770b2]|uniref:hypothetical protein n=1 Tax=Variovorax sp. 770b2 TaxID=1566271 RepID=UPI0008F3FB7C|nr:hypothetical protein [Variovorax sp. 770b2]SFQ03637.1 hypothetical protein SAMN03159339_5233 [Variovorax sp. 770b2]
MTFKAKLSEPGIQMKALFNAGAQPSTAAPQSTRSGERPASLQSLSQVQREDASQGGGSTAPQHSTAPSRYDLSDKLATLTQLHKPAVLKQELYDRGIGGAAHASTRFFNPLRRTDVSAQPTMGQHARLDGQAVPTMPAKMRDAAPIPTGAAVEGPRLKSLKRAPALSVMLQDAYPLAAGSARTALAEALVDTAAVSALTHEELHLLTGALTQAHPQDIARATACLTGLREMRLVDELAHPQSSPVTAQVRRAWTFAVALDTLIPGKSIDILDKITDRASSGDASSRRPQLDTDQRDAVLCYLIAAKKVGGTSVDPYSIYTTGKLAKCIDASRKQSHRNGASAQDFWPGRSGAALPTRESLTGPSVRLNLHEKALLAIHDIIDPNINEVHGCRFTAYRVLNGLASGKARKADGSPSDERYIMDRTLKGRTWMDRARAPRSGRAAFKLALTHHGKSPFLVVNKVASEAGMTLSHNGGIHHGHATKEMIETLEQALEQQGGTHNSPLPSRDSPIHPSAVRPTDPEGLKTLRNMVRKSLLDGAKAEVGPLFPRYNLSRPVLPDAIVNARASVLACIRQTDGSDGASTVWPKDILDAVDALLADATPAPTDPAQLEDWARSMRTGTEQNRPLTPQCLLDWAADVGGPRDADAAMALQPSPAAPGEPDWARFASHYARVAMNEAPEPEIVSLEGKSHEEACLVIAEMIRGKVAGDSTGEELASGFTLEHGGNSGFNTRSVSQKVSGALKLGAARAYLEAGVQYTRRVSFESRSAAERSGLVMRVQTFLRMPVGVGAAVGPSGGTDEIGASLAAGGGVSYAWKLIDEEGVNWNFPRDRSGGLANDLKLADKKARLFLLLNGVADPQGAPYLKPSNAQDRSSGGVPELINLALQEFGPALSINRYEIEHSVENGPTYEFTVGAGAHIGPVPIGLAPTKIQHEVRMNTTRQQDLTGALRVDKETRNEHVVDRATGAVAATVFDRHEADIGDASTLDAHADVMLVAPRSVDFRRKGEAETMVRIHRNDKTLPTSYFSTAQDRPNDFYKAYGARIEGNSQDMNRKFYPARQAVDAVRESGKQVAAVSQFVGRHAQRQDMTMKFADWYELGDLDDSDTALRAQASLEAARGDDDQARATRAEADQLLREPANQQARYVIAANTRSVGTTLGPNGHLGATYNEQYTFTERSVDFI